MRPKPTGSATQKKKIQEMLKKKKKDALKNKVKEKLKTKKKTKSTKTGLLSKAGLMPVSTPGGIPKVMSQKTAQKDLKPKRPKQRQPQDIPGIKVPRPPKGFPDNPSILRPKNPPRKFMPLKDGGPLAKKIKTSGRMNKDDLARAAAGVGSMLKNIKKNPGSVGMNKMAMDLAKKLKPTGRLNVDDLKRARAMLRKGQKPVLDSKGKPVKNLTQKAGPGKPMSAEQKKQLRRFKDVFKGKMPKRQKKGPKAMIPLIGSAAKGMRKGFGGKNLRSAAKKLKRIM